MIALWMVLLLVTPVWAAVDLNDLPLVDDCLTVDNPLSHGGQWSQRVISTHVEELTSNGLNCGRTLGANGDVGSVWWNVSTYAADQGVAAWVPDPTNGQANAYFGFYLRLTSPGQVNLTDGYQCRFRTTESQVELRVVDNSASTVLTTCSSIVVSPGDSAGCLLSGNTFIAQVFDGVSWTEVCTVNITTGSPVFSGVGYAGVVMTGSDNIHLRDIRLGALATGSAGGEGLLPVIP